MSERHWLAAIGVVVLLGTAGKLAAAASWGILADEAYYWVWSHHLAWGYHDQPPAIAWWLAVARTMAGDGTLALRAGGVLLGVLAPLVCLPHARDRSFLLLWWLAAPPLAWLTLFATPDALLLGAWAAGLAAAASGRWGWAGVLGGVAMLCKLTGGLLVPLLLVGAGRAAWRDARWALPGAVLVPLPHLMWNVANDWVTVRFPLSEGLLHPAAPGLWGPPVQILGQLAVLTPPLAIVGFAWLVVEGRRTWRREGTPTDRLLWWTSAPVVLGFAVAAVGGPPEAHWPAPAWIGIGIGLSRATGRLADSAWIAAWLGLFASLLVAAHATTPLTRLPKDPATRLTEGAIVAELVGRWALPEGVGAREPGVADAVPVLTERYQEAALIHYHLGVPARKAPGCGRVDQYDRWHTALPEVALFVKPSTSGPDLCTDDRYRKRGPHRMRGEDAAGRAVGHWDVWELGRE